ncbi:hypothetical protein JOD43_000084 [Pullulanibacillus pueri]|uniref:DUF2207 domain-containing protein n=1 Tax=Pullulanibacillus pueri TaxID=1437324 RepID=A0A8J2ZQI9_9BACL|nr:DUF2207 domain-containing protein [Pullulanibacillus pueri]MBM7679925.1 hypothetical protein [Pullulanibacillus pueri]GGH73521.1 hypothetical protein GCM10007096_00830 [Pullulanibacillus pueri]
MKKALGSLIFFLGVFFLLAGCGDKTFTINQVEIKTDILADGSMTVKELYNYHFQGSFKGTTRSIHDAKVENFKAYLIPSNTKDKFSTKNAIPLKTTKDKDDDDNTIYKTYTQSQNESKQVLYTYTVKNVVKKYRDAAFINYSFYDSENESDLHNVTIHYQFAQALNERDHAYLHDYTGKAELQKAKKGFDYHIDTLPAGSSTEVHFLLEPSAFSEKATDAPENKYEALQQKEDKLHERLIHRSERLEGIKQPLLVLSGVVLVLVFMALIIKIQRRMSRREEIVEMEIGELDPLYVHFLDQRLAFSHGALTAGLLSLVRRRVVRLEKATIHEKYIKDEDFPNETLRFTLLVDKKSLSEADRFLVSWLFTERYEGKPSFTLDSIYGPTEKEKEKSEKAFKKKAERFQEKFSEWQDLLLDMPAFSRERFKTSVRAFPIIALLLTVVFAGVVNLLFFIDGMAIGVIVAVNICLAILLLASFIVYLMVHHIKIVFYGYFFVGLISLLFLHTGAPIALSLLAGLAIVCLFVIIPSERWLEEKLNERRLLKAWKRSVKAERLSVNFLDQERLEDLLYIAIVLGISEDFMATYQKDDRYQTLEKTSPLLQNPDLMTSGMDPSLFLLMFATSSSATSTTSSTPTSTGGGGAGAF